MGRVFVFLNMNYGKGHLNFEEQAELLINRGLIADKALLLKRLKAVGYYRLSAYFHPYRIRKPDGTITDDFRKGTSLKDVWSVYLFDRKLRLHLLDAIERIEVALRCMIAYYHTENHSPFDYASPSYFPKWKDYEKTLQKVHFPKKAKNFKPSHPSMLNGPEFIVHFIKKYGDVHEYLPLWMAVSIFDFGEIVHFYTHSSKHIRKKIAHEFGVGAKTLSTWLTSLRLLRNDCAHHARIWNKSYVSQPKLDSDSAKEWGYVYHEEARSWKPPNTLPCYTSLLDKRDHLAPLIFICRFLIKKIANTSSWHHRLQDFLLKQQKIGIDLSKMGLPEHWEIHPLWL